MFCLSCSLNTKHCLIRSGVRGSFLIFCASYSMMIHSQTNFDTDYSENHTKFGRFQVVKNFFFHLIRFSIIGLHLVYDHRSLSSKTLAFHCLLIAHSHLHQTKEHWYTFKKNIDIHLYKIESLYDSRSFKIRRLKKIVNQDFVFLLESNRRIAEFEQ